MHVIVIEVLFILFQMVLTVFEVTLQLLKLLDRPRFHSLLFMFLAFIDFCYSLWAEQLETLVCVHFLVTLFVALFLISSHRGDLWCSIGYDIAMRVVAVFI